MVPFATAWKADVIRNTKPRFLIAWVQIGKAYVSFHHTEKLQQLWSPLMIVNNPQSTITPDRAAILAPVHKGAIKYSSFERTIEAVRFHEGLAIVMGAEVVEAIGTNPRAGQKVKRRFTNIWRQADGRCQVIARHANVIPE